MNEKFLSITLRKLGIPASLTGFRYIIDAIEMIDENEQYLHCITKALYPDIAKMHNVPTPTVERNIRHAIETAFSNGNKELLEEICQYAYDPQKGKTTNREFLGNLIEWLRYEREWSSDD